MKKWKSIALWEHCHGFQDDTTTDTHETKEQAESVCRMLEKDGLGGERCHFPILTRVEPIEDAPAENSGAVANGPTTAAGTPCGASYHSAAFHQGLAACPQCGENL